jgi:hypothetical protein
MDGLSERDRKHLEQFLARPVDGVALRVASTHPVTTPAPEPRKRGRRA